MLAVGRGAAEPGEADCVGMACGDTVHAPTGAADEERHARLDGPGIAPFLDQPVVPAGHGDRVAIEELAEHDDRLFEAFHPHARGLEPG